jgi:hypothetical protein
MSTAPAQARPCVRAPHQAGIREIQVRVARAHPPKRQVPLPRGRAKWGKDWLLVCELGQFDFEPGPVRDMWLEMFRNVFLSSAVW